MLVILKKLQKKRVNKKDRPKNNRRNKIVSRLLLIDGNSIMNRAFYGIMGSKMLTTPDGRYTNAVYGFLAILFKVLEDLNPEYIGVAFDLKAPTARHKMYEGYKANRHGMPDELAQQMPMIKQILRQMNIEIVEKEGYEADDVLRNPCKTMGKRRSLCYHSFWGPRYLPINFGQDNGSYPKNQNGKNRSRGL